MFIVINLRFISIFGIMYTWIIVGSTTVSRCIFTHGFRLGIVCSEKYHRL